MTGDGSDRDRDRQTVAQFFDYLGGGQIDDWLALIADDVHVETPFAAGGSPTTFDGIEEVNIRFGDARKSMMALEFYDIEILATEDPGRWAVTCKSRGEFAGQVKYQNRYSWYFRLENGLITEWVEYYDPQETMAVQDAIEKLGQ
jgi:ketosteroid isomerase-like protein